MDLIAPLPPGSIHAMAKSKILSPASLSPSERKTANAMLLRNVQTQEAKKMAHLRMMRLAIPTHVRLSARCSIPHRHTKRSQTVLHPTSVSLSSDDCDGGTLDSVSDVSSSLIWPLRSRFLFVAAAAAVVLSGSASSVELATATISGQSPLG